MHVFLSYTHTQWVWEQCITDSEAGQYLAFDNGCVCNINSPLLHLIHLKKQVCE